MQIKTYKAFSMKDVLARVKAEMGSNAVIISTRQVKEGGFGLMTRPMVEVTAAVDYDQKMYRSHFKEGYYKDNSYSSQGRAHIPRNKNLNIEGNVGCIASEVAQLKDMINVLLKRSGVELNKKSTLKHALISRGISESIVELIISKMGDNVEINEIKKLLVRIVRISKAPTARTCIFLGATGVGKTTTIAKIAARAVLNQGKKVGIITLDTYRIGAIEQAQTYAKILSIPFRSVTTPDEFKMAVSRFNETDLILVDTVGRSPFCHDYIKELHQFFDNIPMYKFLLVPVATRDIEMERATKNFSEVGVDSMIFTKADEAITFGSIITHNLLFRSPIAYITVGQKVPEDIEEASSSRIVELCLGDIQ
ncbi:MAG: flagellar biosynthesis protein FlhF [Deltaproteobacteria bacterium]|nr:flagellar biosynthesis protein FlhF [Deltaproteobacteria bacterium]